MVITMKTVRVKLKKSSKPTKDKYLRTMDRILVIIAITLVIFTVAMIILFIMYQSVPDTLIASVFAVCGGECGAMAWIKTAKEKHREKKDDNGGDRLDDQ